MPNNDVQIPLDVYEKAVIANAELKREIENLKGELDTYSRTLERVFGPLLPERVVNLTLGLDPNRGFANECWIHVRCKYPETTLKINSELFDSIRLSPDKDERIAAACKQLIEKNLKELLQKILIDSQVFKPFNV
jgi:hypothetical protein